jgi:hypothetical protein
MPDEITQEEFTDWVADPRTRAMLREATKYAAVLIEDGKVIVRVVFENAPAPKPTGTEDTDKVGANGRRISVKG